MYRKIDNMIDLRAFCLEQAVKITCEYIQSNRLISHTTIELAKIYEAYILGDVKLPDQPFNTDKLLYDTMIEITKHNKENNL